MPLYGYARVSTLDQDLAIQRAALKTAGCEVPRISRNPRTGDSVQVAEKHAPLFRTGKLLRDRLNPPD